MGAENPHTYRFNLNGHQVIPALCILSRAWVVVVVGGGGGEWWWVVLAVGHNAAFASVVPKPSEAWGRIQGKACTEKKGGGGEVVGLWLCTAMGLLHRCLTRRWWWWWKGV